MTDLLGCPANTSHCRREHISLAQCVPLIVRADGVRWVSAGCGYAVAPHTANDRAAHVRKREHLQAATPLGAAGIPCTDSLSRLRIPKLYCAERIDNSVNLCAPRRFKIHIIGRQASPNEADTTGCDFATNLEPPDCTSINSQLGPVAAYDSMLKTQSSEATLYHLALV